MVDCGELHQYGARARSRSRALGTVTAQLGLFFTRWSKAPKTPKSAPRCAVRDSWLLTLTRFVLQSAQL